MFSLFAASRKSFFPPIFGLGVSTGSKGLPWWLTRVRVCLQCKRTRFKSRVRKSTLENEMATPSVILCLGNPTDGEAWQAAVRGVLVGHD